MVVVGSGDGRDLLLLLLLERGRLKWGGKFGVSEFG